jgi:hypothetical protein
MENKENKKPQLIIIGASQENMMGAGKIALYIANLKEKHEIIFVDSIDKAKDLTGLDLELDKMPTVVIDDMKENPFKNLPICYKALPKLPKLEPFIDFSIESNPFPSPKGKRGKRNGKI